MRRLVILLLQAISLKQIDSSPQDERLLASVTTARIENSLTKRNGSVEYASSQESRCRCQCSEDGKNLICNSAYNFSTETCVSLTCSPREISLINFQLESTLLNAPYLFHIGVNGSVNNIKTLRLRKCTVSGTTTFAADLSGLIMLDLRDNKVKSLSEPRMKSLNSIRLSGEFVLF